MNIVNLLTLLSLTFISVPVMAYIDPASGSAIMSAIIGLFVAIGLAIKTYWYKLKSLFTGKKTNQETNPDLNSEEEEK